MIYEPFFSHVYVEQDAYSYPLTSRILSKLNKAVVIPITHYKDVFNRPGQSFGEQKKSPKLILAVRKEKFIFPGAKVCDNYGYDSFFYATQVMNCPYDCEYCYLRGLYSSANIVAFVNIKDYFNAAGRLGKAYLSISYDTDLLAMEPLFGFASQWIEFIKTQPDIMLEIRTKSTASIKVKPASNIILAWTISTIMAREDDAFLFSGDKLKDSLLWHEKGVPTVRGRLKAMEAAIKAGWKVRLCIDPVILTPDWDKSLIELLNRAKSMGLYDISVGGFRCSVTHYKRMRKLMPDKKISSLPLVEREGVYAYPSEIKEKILDIYSSTLKRV